MTFSRIMVYMYVYMYVCMYEGSFYVTVKIAVSVEDHENS